MSWEVDEAALAALPAHLREQCVRDLAELDQVVEQNPLQVFEPKYSQQEEYLASRASLKMFAGGNQAGKTTIGVADDLIQCVGRDSLPEGLRRFKFWEPPFYCRVIVPQYKLLHSAIFPKTQELVPRGELRGGGWDSAFDKQHHRLHFQNGSWIDYMSYEQPLDAFGSVTLDRVRFDEEPPGEKGRQIFNQSAMRTVARAGQLCFTMTPLFGLSWVEEEVWERRHEPGVFATKASVFDNPTIPHDEIEARAARMTEEERLSIIEGEFSHFEGKVFGEFREARHLVPVPSVEHVRGQEVLVGIDPGIRWTGLVWVAFDNDNAAVVFDAHVLEGSTVANSARFIKQRNERWGVKPRYVIDPSARNRQLVNAEQVESAFAREGVYAMPGQNALEAGVFEMKRRLQLDPPMLVVSRDCRRLVWEVERYRQDHKPDGTFSVVKENDHALDALRYVLMERSWNIGAPPVKERRRPGWIPGTAPAYRPRTQRDHGPLGSMV